MRSKEFLYLLPVFAFCFRQNMKIIMNLLVFQTVSFSPFVCAKLIANLSKC